MTLDELKYIDSLLDKIRKTGYNVDLFNEMHHVDFLINREINLKTIDPRKSKEENDRIAASNNVEESKRPKSEMGQ